MRETYKLNHNFLIHNPFIPVVLVSFRVLYPWRSKINSFTLLLLVLRSSRGKTIMIIIPSSLWRKGKTVKVWPKAIPIQQGFFSIGLLH